MPETSLDQFVEQQIKCGKYPSYDAMVQAGLQLLQEREQELDEIVDALRPAVDDYLRGDRGAELDLDAIKVAGRKRLAETPA